MQRNRDISFWDFVPIVGSIRNLNNAAEDFSDGHNLKGITNTALGIGGLALDIFTFGSASLIGNGLKTGAVKGSQVVISKSLELGVKGIGVAATGYAVKTVATPVLNTTCDIVENVADGISDRVKNSGTRQNSNNNTNRASSCRNTDTGSHNSSSRNTDTGSSNSSSRNTGTSSNNSSSANNNYDKNNRDNNNNNNNNYNSKSGATIHTMTRTELMQWLTSLKIVTFTSSQVQDHELDRLISVLKELSCHSINHPSFLERAIDFARFMKPKNVSSFCSFLMFFATTFVSERDTQMQNADSNKRITKKEAGEKALNILSVQEIIKILYDQALKIVRDNNMAHTQSNQNPNSGISPNLSQSELIQIVRSEASGGRIRFGSEHAAVYHMKKHPMGDEASYVGNANRLIANSGTTITLKKSQYGCVEIEFTSSPDKNGFYSFCVILIKDRIIILKTFFSKRK